MSLISIKIHIQICWIKLNLKLFEDVLLQYRKGIQGWARLELTDTRA